MTDDGRLLLDGILLDEAIQNFKGCAY